MDEFFSSALARRLAADGRAADVIHANNVLAHVADLTDVVAGVAALLTAQGRSRADVIRILKQTARTPVTGTRGTYTPVYGYGIVDAQAAVLAP